MCPGGQLRVDFFFTKPNVSIVWCVLILIVISISGVLRFLLPNYWFPDFIHLYTERTQEVILAKHKC